MTETHIHALYGQPPRQLAEVAVDAVQCSPLMPGAQALEAYAPESLASAVIHAPPGTLERRYLLALTLQALAVGAPLTAMALKDKGGSRIAQELRHFGCTVEETARSHYRLCHTTRPTALQGVEEAVAQGGPQLHAGHGLWTQPGIFSWDRLDAGSALLLEHLPALSGNVADLGCGLGVLSRAVLHAPAVTQLLLMDVDRRAVEAARRNITDPRAQFLWADIRDHALAPQSYDAVVMNPPFHDAGMEDHSLGQYFIEQASLLLKPGGQCWLTANRHLPYEALLAKGFRRVHAVAEANGFKIYHAEK